jgi:hypothetical protein
MSDALRYMVLRLLDPPTPTPLGWSSEAATKIGRREGTDLAGWKARNDHSSPNRRPAPPAGYDPIDPQVDLLARTMENAEATSNTGPVNMDKNLDKSYQEIGTEIMDDSQYADLHAMPAAEAFEAAKAQLPRCQAEDDVNCFWDAGDNGGTSFVSMRMPNGDYRFVYEDGTEDLFPAGEPNDPYRSTPMKQKNAGKLMSGMVGRTQYPGMPIKP